MTLPPPCSSLFPYTTLFRSQSPSFTAVETRPRLLMKLRKVSSTLLGEPTGLDRKSTRLNSSHSQISYAVFCLKKKTDVHIKVIIDSARFLRYDDARARFRPP